MNAQQKMALADFVREAALGIEDGDIEGVAVLYKEMAQEAENDGVMLPLQATIRIRAERHTQGLPLNNSDDPMTDKELAAWMNGWAYQFDPRTAE